MLNWYRSRGVLHRTIFRPDVPQPPSPRPADPAMRVTPIGLTLEVASNRAPAALHLMSLVATGTEALITVVMRMHWPPDGTRRRRPVPPSCSPPWPLSCRTSTGHGSA
jgi:hypothetical protein